MAMLVGLLILQFVLVANSIQCYTLTQTQVQECHQCSTTIFSSDNGKSWLYFSKKCWIKPCDDFVHVSFGYIYQMKCCNTTLCNDELFMDFNPRYRNDPTTTPTTKSSSSNVFSQPTIYLSLSTSYSVDSSISPMLSPSPTITTSSIKRSNNILYIIISIVVLLITISFGISIAVIVFARKCISKTTYSLPMQESQTVHREQVVSLPLPIQTLPPQSNDANPMSHL